MNRGEPQQGALLGDRGCGERRRGGAAAADRTDVAHRRARARRAALSSSAVGRIGAPRANVSDRPLRMALAAAGRPIARLPSVLRPPAPAPKNARPRRVARSPRPRRGRAALPSAPLMHPPCLCPPIPRPPFCLVLEEPRPPSSYGSWWGRSAAFLSLSRPPGLPRALSDEGARVCTRGVCARTHVRTHPRRKQNGGVARFRGRPRT